MRYVLSEIVNLLWAEQKLVLVEPFAERRCGKLLELRIARGHCEVPEYDFVLNQVACHTSAIVKSLSSELIGNKVLFTTRAQTCDLDERFPWFVQQYIKATHDVTVVFVRGQMFAFSLERDFLHNSIDWRQHISPTQRWAWHVLPAYMNSAIVNYMQALKLDFGRFDFC